MTLPLKIKGISLPKPLSMNTNRNCLFICEFSLSSKVNSWNSVYIKHTSIKRKTLRILKSIFFIRILFEILIKFSDDFFMVSQFFFSLLYFCLYFSSSPPPTKRNSTSLYCSKIIVKHKISNCNLLYYTVSKCCPQSNQFKLLDKVCVCSWQICFC